MNRIKSFLFVCAVFFVFGFTFELSAASKKKSAAIDLGYKSGIRTETALSVNPRIKSGVLENGMTYYVMSNPEPTNRISLRLIVKAGSCMEDDDQRGIAHLVEHMAFNGTEHFEGRELIDFVESIGMQWGPDLNAYTSYEETVYMLEIPADNREFLDKALLILKDWATAVTFEPSEIEKEKGVVTEEWRLSQGANQRVWDVIKQTELKDSRFLNREPIGKTDVIAAVKPERVVDFYKKWYRPELMAVAVVGDFSETELETAVKNVMQTIPPSEKRTESVKYKIPLPSEKSVLVVKDRELKSTNICIESRDKNPEMVKTKEKLFENLFLDCAAQIINQRFSETAQKSDSPFLSASVGHAALSNSDFYKYIWITPKENQILQSLESIMTEFFRVTSHGITQEELNRTKASYRASFKQLKNNLNKISSGDFMSQITASFITGSVAFSYESYVENVLEEIELVTVEDIDFVIKKYFGGMGEFLYVQANENVSIPSEQEIFKIWTEFAPKTVEAYVADEVSGSLMEKPKGKVKVSSKKKLKALGATEYVLENGARIIMKKTQFEKDVVRMNAISSGGFSYVKDEDIPSAALSSSYMWYSGINGRTLTQTQKILSDKVVSVDFGLNRSSEFFTGKSSSEDSEIVLQILNQCFTNPQFTEDGWNLVYQMYEAAAKNFGSSVNDAINAQVKTFFYDNSPYYILINQDFISKLDRKKSEKVFRDRFSNIADFAFVFVGDFNEKKLLELCKSYIGTIPGNKNNLEEYKSVYYSLPNGIQTSSVKKGTEPQAFVQLMFRGNLPPAENVDSGFEDTVLLASLARLLESKLYEVVREDQSGTYGVNVNSSIGENPKRQFIVGISFGCAPERVHELKDSVISVIEDLRKNGIDQSYADKISEMIVRKAEMYVIDNSWWLGCLKSVYIDKTEPESVGFDLQKRIPLLVTPQKMQELAGVYLDTKNYFFGYLIPEK